MGGVSSVDITLVLNAEIDPITGRLLTDDGGGGGSSGFQQPISGTVNGSNRIFTFSTAPNAVVVDGATLQKLEQGSFATQNWTGTTTITLLVAPTQSVFAIA